LGIVEAIGSFNPPPKLDFMHDFPEFIASMESLAIYESICFEKHLLEKAAPNDVDMVTHAVYRTARQLEVRTASESRSEAAKKRISTYLGIAQQFATVDQSGTLDSNLR
jgi:hypothetical protein